MPGCGKSTLTRALGRKLGRDDFDCDEYVRATAGMSIADIFAREGEYGFRLRETRALEALCAGDGCVIAAGSGCVTREENYPLLRRNSTVFWLRREPLLFPQDGRLLPRAREAKELYEARKPLYERFADVAIDNDGTVEETMQKIISCLENGTEDR